MRNSPGARVANIMSVISNTPSELASPALMTGRGLSMSSNAGPAPRMTDHTSPTIWAPAGIVIVLVTTYVPWSKKMIFRPEYCDRSKLAIAPCKVRMDAHFIQNPLNRGRIVCFTVALRSQRTHADELINGEILILRVRPSKDAALAIKEALRFLRRRLMILDELSPRAFPAVRIATYPMLDSRRSSFQDHGSVGYANCCRDVLQSDVVENDGA